jgi:hypothetical protein
LRRIVVANAAERYAVSTGWQPTLSHRELTLEPDGVAEVEFAVTVPPGAAPGARQAFNVVVMEAVKGRLLGGVTMTAVVE